MSEDIMNSSNDDSMEERINKIRMYQSGPVDSKMRGYDPRMPVAMVADFPPIEEHEEPSCGDVPVGSETADSTMEILQSPFIVQEPLSDTSGLDLSPENLANNSSQFDAGELVIRLDDESRPSLGANNSNMYSVSLNDAGNGIALHTSTCTCTSADTSQCLSLDNFHGTIKIESHSKTVNQSQGNLSVNEKRKDKLKEDLFANQLKLETIENCNRALANNTSNLEDELKNLENLLHNEKNKLAQISQMHETLLNDYANSRRIFDEARRFEMCATDGAQQIITSLKSAYDEQLQYSKVQKQEIIELTQRINKLSNERKNFIKLAEGRLKRHNDKATKFSDRLVYYIEQSIALGQTQKAEIDELEDEIDNWTEENDKLKAEILKIGYKPPGTTPDGSLVSKLEETHSALQNKLKDLSAENRNLLMQNECISAISSSKRKPRTGTSTAGFSVNGNVNDGTSTVNANGNVSDAIDGDRSKNVSFSGIGIPKDDVGNELNKTF